MTQRLIKRLSALGQYEEAVAALNAVAQERPASLKSKQGSAQRSDILSMCDDPFILAQQLTHIELVRCSALLDELFYRLRCAAFLRQPEPEKCLKLFSSCFLPSGPTELHRSRRVYPDIRHEGSSGKPQGTIEQLACACSQSRFSSDPLSLSNIYIHNDNFLCVHLNSPWFLLLCTCRSLWICTMKGSFCSSGMRRIVCLHKDSFRIKQHGPFVIICIKALT